MIILTLKNNLGHLLPIALITMLSGCQLLQSFNDSEPHSVVYNAMPENIPSHEFQLSDQQTIIGNLAKVTGHENDTLSDIARHYGLGYNEITIANPNLDPWLLSNSPQILLPLRFILPAAPHQGLVLNLASMRIFYYSKSQPSLVLTYPVGIGRDGWNTPLGFTQITSKKINPDWTVPDSIKREHLEQGEQLPDMIPAGPDNPLGDYAMGLGFNRILIHGTNKPYGIGMQISHGCIQLYPEDIELLFTNVEIGTPVRIVHQPYLTAWENEQLYLEAHAPLEKWAKQNKQLQTDIRKQLSRIAAEKKVQIDWPKVERTLQRTDGLPTPVLVNSLDISELREAATPLQHPAQLYRKPAVKEFAEQDWSIVSNRFASPITALKLTAMLNHYDTRISARMIEMNGSYQVLAGPFRNAKEMKANLKRFSQTFDVEFSQITPKQRIENKS